MTSACGTSPKPARLPMCNLVVVGGWCQAALQPCALSYNIFANYPDDQVPGSDTNVLHFLLAIALEHTSCRTSLQPGSNLQEAECKSGLRAAQRHHLALRAEAP